MPVIGNGNVSSSDEAQRMMLETGCDAVMIARAAIRNPWIFRQFPLSAPKDCSGLMGGEAGPNRNLDLDLEPVSCGPSEEYWPSMDQLKAAESEYFDSIKISNSKQKYVDFHRRNFERLKTCLRTGNRSAPVGSPRTIHL